MFLRRWTGLTGRATGTWGSVRERNRPDMGLDFFLEHEVSFRAREWSLVDTCRQVEAGDGKLRSPGTLSTPP